jgi:hypothetical protein
MITPEPKVIELRMREIAQLFNSLDPSPFLERDLDANAEEFIVSWAAEIPLHHELKLVIHLATAPASTVDVREAVRGYFQHRAEHKQREFSQLLWRGRLSLLVGVLFMAACLAGSELVQFISMGAVERVVREGLLIMGWVAMWRPLEIYLYDWWPLRTERRNLQRLARMEVTVIVPDQSL